MNINRHNYEEYFLLYVDRELTAAERTMVEAFVAANPDLKAELELLEQATFTMDAQLDSEFKAQLLKPVTADITEEQLLLFVDDELTASETAQVKESIAADAVLQNELRWLQRSKLTADTAVVFPDKSLLYKETQPARVFYMSTAVRRWSAAAAVVLMLGTGWWLMNRNSTTQTGGLVEATTVPAKTNEQATAGKIQLATSSTAQSNEPATLQPVNTNSNTSVTKQKPTIINPLVEQKKNDAVAVQTNKPQQTQQPVVQQQDTQTAVDPTTIAKTEAVQKNNTDNSNNQPTTIVPQETSIVKTATSFVNNEDEGEEDEQVGLLNENRQRSTGLKGLIKKAKRTFERRTGIQTGDSQVRFAVFAVNTQ